MHISARPLSRYPWFLRLFFWNQRRKYGQVLKPALLWGRVPLLFLGIVMTYGVLIRRRSPLDPALRSLVMVRISQINHCRFCVDLNSAMLAERAGSLERVQALEDWRNDPGFDARERAALEYAEAVTFTERSVGEALMAELRRHFDDDALVELTALIAFQNLSSKFNAALDVPAQGFCVPGPATRPQTRN